MIMMIVTLPHTHTHTHTHIQRERERERERERKERERGHRQQYIDQITNKAPKHGMQSTITEDKLIETSRERRNEKTTGLTFVVTDDTYLNVHRLHFQARVHVATILHDAREIAEECLCDDVLTGRKNGLAA